MRISSVRLGHANNSSSSHSILLGSTSPQVIDCERSQYGKEWFHLKSREWKANYLSTLVYSVLTNRRGQEAMSPKFARIIARELTGDDPMAGIPEDMEFIYVDGQSVPAFPKAYRTNYLDTEFMREFVEYIRDNPNLSIRGGNDEEEQGEDRGGYKVPVFDGKPHPLFDEGRGRWPKPYPYGDDEFLYARKDGDWWILYNSDTGAKIRLSFKDNPAPYVPKTPELVDLSITDRCGRGCKFCYRSSTPDGEDAECDRISSIAYVLTEAKVFEVALGGGEPTRHPDFAKILKLLRNDGLTPNFSTATMDWARCKEDRKAVIECCGSFAVSDPFAIKDIVAWNEQDPGGGKRFPKATLQLALGCHPEETLRRSLTTAKILDIPVTILGYKKFGRAADVDPHPYGWIVDFIARSDEEYYHFGADSVFVAEFRDELVKRGVSEKLMVNQEGAHSCFIDAVSMMMGPSSFTKDLHPVNEQDLFDHFPYAKEA